jgi:hypothetical protein
MSSEQEILEALTPSVTVADHFPAVRPACKEVAAKFFHCFSSRTKDSLRVLIFYMGFDFSIKF